MSRLHHQGVERSTRLMITAMIFCFPGGEARAQAPNPVNAIRLSSGTIIDPARGVAYVMSEKGGIAKINLSNGGETWVSNEASRPLGLGPAGQRLIGQTEAAPTPNHLAVTLINAEDGKAMKRPDGGRMGAAHLLPSAVHPATTSTPHGEFSATAQAADNHAVVTWHYVPRPRRGLPPGVEEKLQPRKAGVEASKAPAAPPKPQSGTFQLNLTNGEISTKNAAPVAPGAPGAGEAAATRWRPVEVPEPERIPGVKGHQFYTEDKHFIMSHGETPPDANGQYTMVIYDRETKKPVGEFKTLHTVVPSYVTDSRVIYQTTRAKVRSGGGLIDQPPMLKAVDLKNGQQLWAYPLRDTTYRGPYPP